jgi:ABC-2 type transport system ATP-binding protein
MLFLLEKDHGEISYFVDGSSVDFQSIVSSIAYMPEQQSLYSDLSVREHLRFFASMYGIDKEIYKEKKHALLEMTRLEKFLDRPAGKLSGGMYKKLGLMCALLRSPKVILLDEPTNGVDPISRREFWDILHTAAKNDITVIMTTAYMDEAERCSHVHLLEDGRVLNHGEPISLLESSGAKDFDDFFIKRTLPPK